MLLAAQPASKNFRQLRDQSEMRECAIDMMKTDRQSGSSGPGRGFLLLPLGNNDFKAPIMSLVRDT